MIFLSIVLVMQLSMRGTCMMIWLDMEVSPLSHLISMDTAMVRGIGIACPSVPKDCGWSPRGGHDHPVPGIALSVSAVLCSSPTQPEQPVTMSNFLKVKADRSDPNWEAGGLLRVTLDRTSPLYKVIYNQRTCCERINSQAKELGIERGFSTQYPICTQSQYLDLSYY